MNKELRTFNITNTTDTRKVGGYAIVWNSLSVDLGGFREMIAPTAVTEDLIKNSDIIFNYNHDNNYMLGRSRNGEGTLSLSIDETGLYFECELPNSPMGDNIRESIKRGDLSQCSFAFSIDPNDDTAETWEQKEDGIYRTINHIDGLYDVSCVNFPAYEATSISERAQIQLNNIMKKEDEIREDENIKDEEIEQPQEEEKKSEEQEQDDENRSDENPEEEKPEEEKPEEEEKEDNKEDEEQTDETRNINTNKSRFNKMEKEIRFSLLKAIREVANGQKFDEATQAVVNAGAEAMRNAGQSYSGQIQLPVAETRAPEVHYTVASDGDDVVVTDYLSILEPLKAKNVLVAAGANYLTGLQGNLQIPSMTAENVFWEGEIDETENGAGSFNHVNMAPRRLSAYVDISKQFLVQDTLGAENLIRKLLVEAINDKLEATILSNEAASGAKPAGIFYNVTPAEISDYASVCNLEASLDENNFVGDFKYVINPKAKAALRSMIKGTNATGMVLENNAIDGTPAEVTTHMAQDTIAYGDWSNLYIGQWGGIDLTVDNYTQATKGCVRLVINAFFDYKVVRDGAIVLGQYTNE
ncbi:MAG: HK97 family phage prohead protease [Methanobrevibacter sp.]|nr:HK97 family phage prohead protease [Methanobrevibacter sp.]